MSREQLKLTQSAVRTACYFIIFNDIRRTKRLKFQHYKTVSPITNETNYFK